MYDVVGYICMIYVYSKQLPCYLNHVVIKLLRPMLLIRSFHVSSWKDLLIFFCFLLLFFPTQGSRVLLIVVKLYLVINIALLIRK